MKKPAYLALVPLALCLAACKKPEAKPTNTDEPGVTSGTTDTVGTVPDSLKNAAFEYMGLGSEQLLTYTVTMDEAVGEQEGTMQNELVEVKDGSAEYKITRSGGLARLGVETVSLDEKGVSTLASSVGVIKGDTLQMPADVAVGSEWTSDTVLEQGTTTIESKSTNKVSKQESVTVPAGTYDCIVVESEVKGTVSGSPRPEDNGPITQTLVGYFAKGIGIVKLELVTKRADGVVQNTTMTLKSVGE